MRKNFKNIGLTAILVLSVMVAAANAQMMSEMTLYGVTTTGELVSFKSSKPGKMLKMPKMSGMQTGEKLVGVDFRPSNKMLYGVSNQNRIYTINTATGAVTAVGTLTTALTGGNHGVDFNPVPDRLRITNDAAQNLRANPADATNVVDKALAFAVSDANSGKNASVAASAYTNNFAGTKATMLYNIDSAQDVLLTQIPPNDGVLNTVGKLGVNVTGNAGFDIISIGEGNNVAVAALQVEGEKNSKLYSINLTSGAATLVGKIGGKNPLVALTAGF
jgi:hypothetical protein